MALITWSRRLSGPVDAAAPARMPPTRLPAENAASVIPPSERPPWPIDNPSKLIGRYLTPFLARFEGNGNGRLPNPGHLPQVR